ncbi:MAG: MGH1-like glycoside hydrolase domain-containing protein [Phycisphaerae bacterium]
MPHNEEQQRVASMTSGDGAWREWGPYLSERQWGTVREDYSPHGNAWDYFPHDHARSRAYRWGEDGIAGVSDDQQRLCLSLALWNGRDQILKERLFGLTNSEGNHGEDVKELYYYLDATPTHSYLKMLYKYPQAEFPYARLVDENRSRGKDQPEFELLDTGILDDDRYFDVFVEYAKADERDLLMLITVHNRGPEDAPLHVLPQVCFRNTWSWADGATRPRIEQVGWASPNSSPAEGIVANQPTHGGQCPPYVVATHAQLGQYRIDADGDCEWLLCENETNTRRLFGNDSGTPYAKDAFHERVIHDHAEAVNPDKVGTKAAAWFKLNVPARGSAQVRIRLTPSNVQAVAVGAQSKVQSRRAGTKSKIASPFADFDAIFETRRREADAFYADIQRDIADADARLVQRQAFAGMIWNKQFFYYDVPQWIAGDAGQPPPPRERRHGRNREWSHLNNADIISMPDKWEYPWYAAWDLAFHMIPLAMIDATFAKDQLVLLTREWYMHPNGQLPAYEWAFGDVNPPVHAWATWRVFEMDRAQRRAAGDSEYAGDLAFLERVYHKLMLNFTWWVNRKDAQGRNIFQGGFLGLDNIGVFDRSAPLPTGGFINQADGTSWMAMYCLNLMRIALELAQHNRVYEDIATKFFEHFLHIAEAMNGIGAATERLSDEATKGYTGVHSSADACDGVALWCDEDQFFYDVLNMPDGRVVPMKVRSMVGLIPLFAVETLEPELLDRVPEFKKRLEWFLNYRPDLAALVSHWDVPGMGQRRLLSLLRGHRMKALLRRMLDETEFLSDYGVRALSRVHADQPYVFPLDGHMMTVRYQPAESDSGAFGGNSNWRGPIWFPVNYLLIESLRKFHGYYGDEFKVECPTGSGRFCTIAEVADELSRRLTRIFLRDATGHRPVFGAPEQSKTQSRRAGTKSKIATDPHFRDYPLFHEYFDGDTGRGVGASHQCGWTGLVAKLLAPRSEEAGPVESESDARAEHSNQSGSPAQSAVRPESPNLTRTHTAAVPIAGGP